MRFISILVVLLLNLLLSGLAQAQDLAEIMIKADISSYYSLRQGEDSIYQTTVLVPGYQTLSRIPPGQYTLNIGDQSRQINLNPGKTLLVLYNAEGEIILPQDLYGDREEEVSSDVPLDFQSEVDYNVNLVLRVYNTEADGDYMGYFTQEEGKQLLLAHGTFQAKVVPGKYRLQVYHDDDPSQEAQPQTFEVDLGYRVTITVCDSGFGPEIKLEIIGSESFVVEAERAPPPSKSPPQILDEINPLARAPRLGFVAGYHNAIGEFGAGKNHADPKDYLGNQSGFWMGGEVAFNRYLVSIQALIAYDFLMPGRPWVAGFQASAGFDFTHARAWWGWMYQAQGIDTTLGYHYNHDTYFVAADCNPLQYVWGDKGEHFHFGGGYAYDGYGYLKKNGGRGPRLLQYPFFYIKFNSSF